MNLYFWDSYVYMRSTLKIKKICQVSRIILMINPYIFLYLFGIFFQLVNQYRILNFLKFAKNLHKKKKVYLLCSTTTYGSLTAVTLTGDAGLFWVALPITRCRIWKITICKFFSKLTNWSKNAHTYAVKRRSNPMNKLIKLNRV